MTDEIQTIGIDRIRDPKAPMRTELERNGLFDLAENIKQNGLINPITVRPVGDFFEVVAGHRRFSACKIAGMVTIRCVVRELDDKQAFEVMAAENLERLDVDPVDEAVFVERFIRETGNSVADVARALRRGAAWVEGRLAVGQMPDYMKDALKSGKLKLGAALALAQITDDNIRHMWVQMAIRDGVSVPVAEYWLAQWQVQQLPGGTPSETPPADFVAAPPAPIMHRCAFDGKEYDARQFSAIMVHESNLPKLRALIDAWREAEAAAPDPVAPLPPHSVGEGATL